MTLEFAKSELLLWILCKAFYDRHRARRRIYEAQWREENPDKEKAKFQKYEKTDKAKARLKRYAVTGKAKARTAKYVASDKNREKAKRYYRKFPERQKARHAAYAKNNREQIRKTWRETRKKAYHNNVEMRLKINHRNRVSREIGKIRQGRTSQSLLGCSYPELKAWIEAQFKPGMTWNNYGPKGWHVDHKLPISSFDLTKPEHVKVAFHYTNLQPLWWQENNEKRAKVLPEFAGRNALDCLETRAGSEQLATPGKSFIDSHSLSA